MNHLLRISAAQALAWAVLLLAAPQWVAGGPPDPLALTLGHDWAAAQLVLAGLFYWAARNPAANLPIIVAAIVTTAGRVVVDLVGLLGPLPPAPGVFFVADLLLGFALLVGLLEALPRTLPRRSQRDDSPPPAA